MEFILLLKQFFLTFSTVWKIQRHITAILRLNCPLLSFFWCQLSAFFLHIFNVIRDRSFVLATINKVAELYVNCYKITLLFFMTAASNWLLCDYFRLQFHCYCTRWLTFPLKGFNRETFCFQYAGSSGTNQSLLSIGRPATTAAKPLTSLPQPTAIQIRSFTEFRGQSHLRESNMEVCQPSS